MSHKNLGLAHIDCILVNIYFLMQNGRLHEAQHMVDSLAKAGLQTPDILLAQAIIKFRLNFYSDAINLIDDLRVSFPDFIKKIENQTEKRELLNYMRIKANYETNFPKVLSDETTTITLI